MAYAPQFRLKRNGVVLVTWSPPYGSPPGTPGSADFTPAGTATRTILDTPGGPAVYTLEVLRDGTLTGGAGSVLHRSLLVQGIRR